MGWQHANKNPSNAAIEHVDVWSVQCGECFKWRVIPTQEEYEEIRSKFIEDPFVCSKKPGMCCDDPACISYDKTRTWVIDKPNIPKTPRGFKRKVALRKDNAKCDCYYFKVKGNRKILRSVPDVVRFLDENPEFKTHMSVKDFDLTTPKIMRDTISEDAAPRF